MTERTAIGPGSSLGPYQIVTLLGSGGMGAVYRARDTRLGRDVAVKVLVTAVVSDATSLERFEAEARMAATLSHPNVLAVYDVGRHAEIPYIVSELLEGETLRARLRRERALPQRTVLQYAAQIAKGLAAAHGKGIVHRDIKPENLFLTQDGLVKILDFGVAKLLQPSGDHPTATVEALTSAGTVLGTVGYMAPEQVRAEPFDHRADIFALGVVVHEMLSGSAPFLRNTSAETMAAILRDEAPELRSGIPFALDRAVHQCLEKRPEDRFHSAHDLGLAFDVLGSATGTVSSLAAPPGARMTRRQLLAWGGTSIALAGVGAAAGALIVGRRHPVVVPSYRRVTFRRGVIRSARLAPDGKTMLYGALWEGAACRVHSVRPESSESRALDIPNANLLAISPSGELALSLGSHFEGPVTYGTLAVVPIAGGAPRQLVESVKFADWSPDGSELALVRRVAAGDQLEYPIGTVLVAPSPAEGTGLGFVRVSPSGKELAFIRYRAPGNLVGKVTVVDRTGATKILSDDYLNIHGLAWKEHAIWYTAADQRNLFRAFHAVTSDERPRLITRTPGNATLWDIARDGRVLMAHTDDRAALFARLPGEATDRNLSWFDASWVADLSPDGRLLLFNEQGQGAGEALVAAYLRGTDGSTPVRLGDCRAMALSPDAKWVLCLPPRGAPTYFDLLPTGPGEARRVEGRGLIFGVARWLPDGQRFVAQGTEKGKGTRLYVCDLESAAPRPITPETVTSWALSPDGTMVAARGPTPAIRLYPIDGGAVRDVPRIDEGATPVGWITAGLLVTKRGASEYSSGRITQVDVASGREQPWKEILPEDRSGLLALLSFRVTPDGRTYAYTWHRATSDLYLVDGLAPGAP